MYFKTEDVRAAATNHWLEVFAYLAPELEPAMRKPGRHVHCPVHGGHGDGFRLFKDAHIRGNSICNSCKNQNTGKFGFSDGFETLQFIKGWTFREAVDHVGRALGVQQTMTAADKLPSSQRHSQSSNVVNLVPQEQRETPAWLVATKEKMERERIAALKYSERLVHRIATIWSECIVPFDAAAEPLRKYFIKRGLIVNEQVMVENDCIRFHPSLAYYDADGNYIDDYPAIVVKAVTPENQVVTLHRTYLTVSGNKAPLDEVKKMMPIPEGACITGSAVRLGNPVNGVLGVAEGLETSLSAFRATGIPCWSLINAALLEAWVPPKDLNISTVIIWADKDRSETGLNAANVLKSRLEAMGYLVFIILPPLPIPKESKGVDWNDVVLGQGVLGFPRPENIRLSIEYAMKNRKVECA